MLLDLLLGGAVAEAENLKRVVDGPAGAGRSVDYPETQERQHSVTQCQQRDPFQFG